MCRARWWAAGVPRPSNPHSLRKRNGISPANLHRKRSGARVPPKASPKIVLSDNARASPFLDFLTENLDLLQIIEFEPSAATLQLGASFFASETDELRTRASEIIREPEKGARMVLMGHTHEIVNESSGISIQEVGRATTKRNVGSLSDRGQC